MSEVKRSAIYDAVTNFRSSLLAYRNPEESMRYRAGREAQYLYAAGSRKRKPHTMRPTNKAADDVVKRDMSNVRAECRQLVRNNPNLSGAMREMPNNVVFKGIKPQVQLGEDEKAIEEAKIIERLWDKWAKHVKLRRKKKQTVVHLWQDGGVFWHFSISSTLHKRGIVPLNLELLEVDHLDTLKNEQLENGNVIKHGIEYNGEGFVVAYWLFEAHPGSSTGMLHGKIFRSKRCDAKYTILVSDPDRASQSLPIPRLASVVCTLRDFEQYQNFERLAARLAAAFSVVVKDSTTQNMSGRSLNGTTATASGQTLPKIPPLEAFINPGSVTQLPEGKDLEIVNNPRPNTAYGDYSEVNLKSISTGTGQSYESFSNDFSDASFSSVRQAISKERRGYMEQQQLLVEEACDPAWELWCEIGYLFDHLFAEDIPVSWQTPGWEYVNPLQDANATKVLMEMGLENPFDAAAGRGRNLEENITKAKRAKKLRAAAGLEEGASNGTETA